MPKSYKHNQEQNDNDRIYPFSIGLFIRTVRRSLYVVISIFLVGIALGVLYILTTPPLYTASAVILFDAQRMKLFREDALFEGAYLNSSVVESEIQVLTSRVVAEDVVRTLALTKNPEFMDPPASWIQYILQGGTRLFTGRRPSSGDANVDQISVAVDILRANTKATRAGLSYVLQVSHTSSNSALAADIANAIAQSYLNDQLRSKVNAAERASKWLEGRLVELRTKTAEADHAVQTYRVENGIINSSRGDLLNEAQIGEINTQLLIARDERNRARAKLAKIQELNRAGNSEGLVAEAFDSDLMKDLRAQYNDAASKRREWSERYSPGHPSALNWQNKMQEIRDSIAREMQQLEEVQRGNVEAADSRAVALERGLAEIVQRSTSIMQAQVKLRELESTAEGYRKVHDSFFQRQMQTEQQQSFTIGDIRIITPASPPNYKSSPRTSLIIPLSAGLGLMLGVGAAFIREALQRGVQTTRQLEEITDAPCLGICPIIENIRSEPDQHGEGPRKAATRDHLGMDEGRHLISCKNTQLSVVIDQPESRFAETIRSIKVAARSGEAGRSAQVIGVTSAVAHEGKSVIAANLGRLAADSGERTLLIDCDLRIPSLTVELTPTAKLGLTDVLLNPEKLGEAVYRDPLTGLDFLPVNTGVGPIYSVEYLSGPAMARLIAECRNRYDCIILDFPPMLPVADVRAAAPIPDAFLMVVDWSNTDGETVNSALLGIPAVRQKLLGTVMNKVDVETLSLYEPIHRIYYRSRMAISA